MKNLYPGDYRTANSIDSHTTPLTYLHEESISEPHRYQNTCDPNTMLGQTTTHDHKRDFLNPRS